RPRASCSVTRARRSARLIAATRPAIPPPTIVTGVCRSRATGSSSEALAAMGPSSLSDPTRGRGCGEAEGSAPAAAADVREPFARPAPLPPVADVARIRAAQAGDAIAMSELLEALQPLVGRLCGSIALDAGPDAAQEALVAVMRDLRGLRDPERLVPWARRLAAREAIRPPRRPRGAPRAQGQPAPPPPPRRPA